jgi:8-oxo-(d)GTP phosphatase
MDGDGASGSLRGPAKLERCAGAVLVRLDRSEVLLIRTRARRYELPKGHLEPGESEALAALRELYEETAFDGVLELRGLVGRVEHRFAGRAAPVHKRIAFYLFACHEARFGLQPRGVRERRWCRADELQTLSLRNEDLRPILLRALERIQQRDGAGPPFGP